MAEELILTPAVEEGMLHRWEALTSDRRMSQEVRRFLELEIEATVGTETLVKRHNALAPVVERVFREGWQVTSETPPRRVEQRGSQMEEALFIAWHAMWRPEENRRYWKLGENTGDLLYRALARQGSAHGLQYDSVFVCSWSGADLSGAAFGNLNLSDADLSDADLGDANLQGAGLRCANLQGTGLEDAILQDANLQGAGLRCANLQGADLQGADLADAVLPEDLQYLTE